MSSHLLEEQPERDVLDDFILYVFREEPKLELKLEVALRPRLHFLTRDLLVHVEPVVLVVARFEEEAKVPVLKYITSVLGLLFPVLSFMHVGLDGRFRQRRHLRQLPVYVHPLPPDWRLVPAFSITVLYYILYM
jgi:hypothetical protein